MIGRARAVSTPTALTVAMWTLVMALLVFAVVGVQAVTQRQDAVETVRSEGAPLVADAESLYVALADADAAASTAYLQAGLEAPELRTRYQRDIAHAAQALSVIGRSDVLTDNAQGALTTLNEQLPLYAADIESARTNNRLGFPVGAAYQRHASDLMQRKLLPAATSLYKVAAQRLDDGHRSGSSLDGELVVVVVAAIVVALIVCVHLYLTTRTKRLLNVGLIGAAVIVIALCTWTSVGLRSQRNALADSQREGSDPLLMLSTARILALRSMSDENLDLIERATKQADDFDTLTASIAGGEGKMGLLDRAADGAADAATIASIAELERLHAQFLATHARVRRLVDDYDYGNAITIARTEEAAASSALDDAFAREIAHSRSSLDSHADAAAADLRMMRYMMLAAALAGAAAVAAGMWPRVREYR